MIVDAHTHVFPAELIAQRERLLAAEPLFAELYSSPRARMATPEDLLQAMGEAGVDRAVVAGFQWRDPELCRPHNDALLAAAAESAGRLLAVCCVPNAAPAAMQSEIVRCAELGARGFGEIRLELVGDGSGSDAAACALGEAASASGLPLLLHASEPVGHAYPGKGGGSLAVTWRFLTEHPSNTVVLAHLGGGLPFFAHMPEVRETFARVYVDTAAVPWLYQRQAYAAVVSLIGADRLLFGSDFPLRHPREDIALLREAGLPGDTLAAVLGSNAARAFGLSVE